MKLALGGIVGLTAICVLAAGFAGPGIAVWFIIPTSVIGVIAALAHAVAARTQSRLAALAERIETVSDECFDLITDPPFHIFAKIGYTPQLVRWYCFPMQAESFLRADSASIELEASPATGYVARLNTVGFYAVDLPTNASSDNGPFTATQSSARSPDISAYMKRVRSYGLSITPPKALWFGIGLLLASTVAALAAVLYVREILFVPYRDIEPLSVATASMLSIPLVARFTIPYSIRGIRLLKSAQRGFYASNEPRLSVEGTVTVARIFDRKGL